MNKGQYVRLFLGSGTSKVIGAAKNMTLHIAAQTEESTTKDDGDDGSVAWKVFDITGRSYDISGSGLVLSDASGDTNAHNLASLLNAMTGDTIPWSICTVSGPQNRTVDTQIASGTVIIKQIKAEAPNRQNTTYSYQLTGVGGITVNSATVARPSNPLFEDEEETTTGEDETTTEDTTTT